MSYIQDILSEYTRMRDRGMETKAVIQSLREHIENLDKAQRQELAALMRAWEARHAQPAPAAPEETKTDSQPRKPPVIKPLVRTVELTPVEAPPASAPPADAASDNGWVACPNCGKPNQKHEVFCYSCGQLLEAIKGGNVTKQLEDAGSLPSSEYFGPESVLALRIRGSSDVFEVRPQKSDHEMIIGRSSSGSAIMPDVDLNTKQAADLGVSRMHMAIHYEPDQNAVLVVDLGSANGTFINGQRVLPKEIRVLRHGDELRLGRLVLMVSFRHPGKLAQ